MRPALSGLMRPTLGHAHLLQLRQAQLSPRLLRGFQDAALEQQFTVWLHHHGVLGRRWLVTLPLLAMLILPVYLPWLLGTVMLAEHHLWLRIMSLGVAAPLCGLSLWTLRNAPPPSWSTPLILLALLAVFVTAGLLRWMASPTGFVIPPGTAMLVPLALASLGRLRLPVALAAVLLCPVVYVLGEWLLGSGELLLPIGVGVSLFTAIAMSVAISNDQLLRRTWLASQIGELTAMSDGVTGLPSRQWLNRDLATLFEHAQAEARPLAVLLIDLDHFKSLNDTHGHAAGDAALAATGATLAQFGRRPMDLTGRFGGEEFLLVLYDAKPYGAERIARELLAAIADQRIPNQGSPRGILTASIGLYLASPTADDRPERFLREADLALYAAKRAGRNGYQVRRAQTFAQTQELEPAPSPPAR